MKLLIHLCAVIFAANVFAADNFVEIPSGWSQNTTVIEEEVKAPQDQNKVALVVGKRGRPNHVNEMGTLQLELVSKNLLFREYKLPVFALLSTEYSWLQNSAIDRSSHFLISKLEIGTRPKFAQWSSGGVSLGMGLFLINEIKPENMRQSSELGTDYGLSLRLKAEQRMIKHFYFTAEASFDQQLQAFAGIQTAI